MTATATVNAAPRADRRSAATLRNGRLRELNGARNPGASFVAAMDAEGALRGLRPIVEGLVAHYERRAYPPGKAGAR